jgi:hypothetical protein
MHGPPAVSCQVKRSPWQLRIIVVFVVLGVAGLFGTLAVGASNGWALPGFGGFLVVAVSAFFAYSGWRDAPSHRLQWDGQSWFWPPFDPNPVHAIHMAVDFQNLLVVRISVQQQSQWMWLERSGSAENWRALRRALVFSAERAIGKAPNAADRVQDGAP